MFRSMCYGCQDGVVLRRMFLPRQPSLQIPQRGSIGTVTISSACNISGCSDGEAMPGTSIFFMAQKRGSEEICRECVATSGLLGGDVKESRNGNPTRDLQMATDPNPDSYFVRSDGTFAILFRCAMLRNCWRSVVSTSITPRSWVALSFAQLLRPSFRLEHFNNYCRLAMESLNH